MHCPFVLESPVLTWGAVKRRLVFLFLVLRKLQSSLSQTSIMYVSKGRFQYKCVQLRSGCYGLGVSELQTAEDTKHC